MHYGSLVQSDICNVRTWPNFVVGSEFPPRKISENRRTSSQLHHSCLMDSITQLFMLHDSPCVARIARTSPQDPCFLSYTISLHHNLYRSKTNNPTTLSYLRDTYKVFHEEQLVMSAFCGVAFAVGWSVQSPSGERIPCDIKLDLHSSYFPRPCIMFFHGIWSSLVGCVTPCVPTKIFQQRPLGWLLPVNRATKNKCRSSNQTTLLRLPQ